MLNNSLRLRVSKIVETLKPKFKTVKPKVVEETIKEVVEPKVEEVSKSNAKTVYVYKGKKCVGIYDSVTKCGAALGMSRLMVRKAIESGEELDNGLVLTFINK